MIALESGDHHNDIEESELEMYHIDPRGIHTHRESMVVICMYMTNPSTPRINDYDAPCMNHILKVLSP